MIKFIDLYKSYGKTRVLKGINFEMKPGVVYGVVGENGAGKTTLFNCLAGLHSFDGSIEIDLQIRKNIGLLDTNPHMMSRITGWEYLKLFCTARSINNDDFHEKNIFDLPLDKYAESYSTGMKKKLALMALLLQKNELFILDEPYNGVDIQSNILITSIISKLKERSKYVVISSHIFSTLRDTCDHILYLDGGVIKKIVAKDDFDQLESDLISKADTHRDLFDF